MLKLMIMKLQRLCIKNIKNSINYAFNTCIIVFLFNEVMHLNNVYLCRYPTSFCIAITWYQIKKIHNKFTFSFLSHFQSWSLEVSKYI